MGYNHYNHYNHFFSSAQEVPSHSKKGKFVDVGGTGDCGFRAMAAALLERYSTSDLIKGRDELLGVVLARYEQLYPRHCYNDKTDGRPLTARQSLQRLKQRVPMLELIVNMAYVLRQIAVDELLKKPDQYPGAFVSQHEGTSPESMRSMNTWIDESSIAALSNALDLPVRVLVVDGDKALPKEYQYNVENTEHSILIKLEKNHYIPYLHENVSHQQMPSTARSVSTTPPLKDPSAFERSLPEALAIIEADQKRMLETFESIRDELYHLVKLGADHGGLSKDDLLTLYIQGKQHSDYLQGRARAADLESGTSQFSDAIKKHERDGAGSLSAGGHDDYLINELVHAIARAVSIGHMDPNAFYTVSHGHGLQR